VIASGDKDDAKVLKAASEKLLSANSVRLSEAAANAIELILYRALASAELNAPAAAQGAFIPAGNSFDALAAFAKVLGTATKDVLMIDPYMDEKALTEFAVLAVEKVTIRLLADEHHKKPSLKSAADRWIVQHGGRRPLEARLTKPRTLHDRLLIIDGNTAWILTQSMNAFASRAPASIVRVDAETASLKLAAYETIWNDAAKL
jgi:hypothetical protein